MGPGLRFEDWPQRLARAIDEARRKPFVWGEHDCVLFSANVGLALTGIDHAAAWRGKYDSEISAMRILHQLGGIETAVRKALGAPIGLARASRGDAVLWRDNQLGPALGICIGNKAVFAGIEGLVFRPMKGCATAWRV